MKFTLNLASRHYVNRRALNHGFVAALILLLLFGGWSIKAMLAQNSSLQMTQQHLSELKDRLQSLRGGAVKPLSPAQRAALETEFRVAQNFLIQDAFRWTRLLDRMEALLPKGVSLVSFRPDFEKDNLEISGQARTLKEMRSFIDSLMKKGDFQQVLLKNHSRTKVRDYAGTEQPAVSFSIQLTGVF